MNEMIIEGKTGNWEVICGLEIHCQIISKSKIFSGASTHYGADVNENVSFIFVILECALKCLIVFLICTSLMTSAIEQLFVFSSFRYLLW